MSIFSKFFKKEQTASNATAKPVPKEYVSLQELDNLIADVLHGDHYAAKSEYLEQVKAYEPTLQFFKVLKSSGQLPNYCKEHGLDLPLIQRTLASAENLEEVVEQSNERYIQSAMVNEKAYLDKILKDVDPVILLDSDQRRVVLTDEDYCLVIAGAGAGKTTTVAAKVKYLVERKSVDPSKILVISFTNKAVQELREKINKDLQIDCPIATFHSTGNAILHKRSPERLNIVDQSKLYFVVQDYLKSAVLTNENLVNKLIMFFSSYFDAPYEGTDLNTFFNKIAKANFNTLRSDLNEFQRQVVDCRTKKAVTIQSEVMRSNQEVQIANFLYLNNIDYEYEPMYEYEILLSRKPYTPDFLIRQGDRVAYIEHFGITESGQNDRYSEDELKAYKQAINDKILLHRQHKTTLIYTFSSYNDRRSLLDHLKEQLEDAGFILTPRSNKEVMEKLVTSEENRYIRKFVSLITRFIGNFKTNGYSTEEFDRMYHSTQNVRSRLFLDICQDCYLEYQRWLNEHQAVDFEDMINESARVLREVKEMKQMLDFEYVIVDEYQDISRQRFDLVTALHEVTKAKIIAVGDDWQSIYAFSGSDISLFTKFAEKMGYAKLLKIVNTYRNSQEVIDIAGGFIQKNQSQISKDLKSPKTITDPVIIYTYDGTRKKQNAENKTGAIYELGKAVETAIGQILEYWRQEEKTGSGSILLLGRFGFDGDHLEKSGLFEYTSKDRKLRSVTYPDANITFMTAHASKGLGYDNVIVVNGKNETYGFPSKIEDDPILGFVIRGDRSIDFAEERRLFYVAMTRTKNRVFFIAPKQNPSEFLLEIQKEFKNVDLRGEWNEIPPSLGFGKKTCPICGYPLQFRYKNAFGLRLYICTNEPEVCSFMTNEIKAGKLSICKCDQCRDGYMIVKPLRDREQYFLGCTNYKSDGSGCNNKIWARQFYEMNNYVPDPVPASEPPAAPVRPQTPMQRTPSVPPVITVRKSAVSYGEENLAQVVQTIMQCLVNISEKHYYGTSILLNVLRGSQSDRIKGRKLDLTPEYGKLKSVRREDLECIVEWLIDNHFILKTKGQYPVLHITPEGLQLEKYLSPQKITALRKQMEKK